MADSCDEPRHATEHGRHRPHARAGARRRPARRPPAGEHPAAARRAPTHRGLRVVGSSGSRCPKHRSRRDVAKSDHRLRPPPGPRPPCNSFPRSDHETPTANRAVRGTGPRRVRSFHLGPDPWAGEGDPGALAPRVQGRPQPWHRHYRAVHRGDMRRAGDSATSWSWSWPCWRCRASAVSCRSDAPMPHCPPTRLPCTSGVRNSPSSRSPPDAAIDAGDSRASTSVRERGRLSTTSSVALVLGGADPRSCLEEPMP